MLHGAPAWSGPGTGGRGGARPLQLADQSAPQCNRAREAAQRADVRARRMVLSWTGRPCGAGTRHATEGRHMSDHSEEVYGPDRAERLLAMLRALAERIRALDKSGRLLERVPELQKLLGNTRSEPFRYEVRLTYDTPEVAESRRIVDEAERQAREARTGFDEDEDDEPWRRVPGARRGATCW